MGLIPEPQVLSQILGALACGGAVGLERELKNKSAGLKTYTLICLGSTLFTMASIDAVKHLNGQAMADPARIAAQIVSGIGFIGGGAIMHSGGAVLGLTTAAMVWVVAAIGIWVGMGFPWVALACVVSILLSMGIANAIEDHLLQRSLSFECEIEICDEVGIARDVVTQALDRNDLSLEDFEIVTLKTEPSPLLLVKLCYRGDRRSHRRMVFDLWRVDSVNEVRQKMG